MKRSHPGRNNQRPDFTIEEHLAVQRKIEQRAFIHWRAAGCRLDTAARDWTRAEREVILEFCQNYRPRKPDSICSGQKSRRGRVRALTRLAAAAA